MEQVSGIYAIVHPSSGRSYIGSSKDVLGRWADHQKHLKSGTHHCHKLQNAWKKYGSDAFAFVMVEHCHPDVRVAREQFWIDQTQAAKNSYGFNLSGLAHAPQPSESGRARIAESNKRRTGTPWKTSNPEAWKEKLSLSKTGKKYGPRNPEVGQRIAASLTGKPHSENRKKNISNSIMALSPEARSARAFKAWETKRAKKEML